MKDAVAMLDAVTLQQCHNFNLCMNQVMMQDKVYGYLL